MSLQGAGFAHRRGTEYELYAERLAQIVGQICEFERLYRLLEDEESRALLVALMAYRVLGDRHVKLPLNRPEYRDAIRMIQRDLLHTGRTMPVQVLGYLDEYDLKRLGFPIRLQAHLLNVLNTFVLEQYRFHRSGRIVEVGSGDVVVDAGACWGDTALYFAHRVGPAGMVISYECEPGNLDILRQNLSQNSMLSERVTVVERALWHTPEERLRFASAGPGSRIATETKTRHSVVPSDTIDGKADAEKLPSVNFIKMDIEGAELNALKGAEQTLRKWRPKLAISVYHRLEHFWQIPDFIDHLDLGYHFYLEHFTCHSEETVLFASVD